ncbi:MAG: quinone-dependent dihydroorotate dehydrogenase [Neomegalonema sp.]|nr:quinone-dependent dihydroorotate dehydrogenase [Neomegalonema sp.]
MISRKLKLKAADAATSALRMFGPEAAHKAALLSLRLAYPAGEPPAARPRLAIRLLGLEFPHPVGIAAGFDKNAVACDPLLRLGAGFVEVGAVTPKPQAGNPTPRLFRLVEDRAVINRMGFNNDGLSAISTRLRARAECPGIVGANLGANKDSEDRMADYVLGLRRLWGAVSFFTINVSSPNTEKLRDLQGGAALTELLTRVIAERDEMAEATESWAPVLVKLAPDLDAAAVEEAVAAMIASGVDGAIISNTTVARPDTLRSVHAAEKGGLSGAPLFEASTQILRAVAQATEGRLPLIGVGGVGDPAQAYAKIRAGASLVQLYSALVYEGPGLIMRIADGLEELLDRDGFASLADAVGADLR